MHRPGARHRGRVPARGLRAVQRGTPRPGPAGQGAVHRERRGRRRGAAPPGRRPRRAAPRRPAPRCRSCTSTPTPARTPAATNLAPARNAACGPATTACSPTATRRVHDMIDRHLVRDLLLRLASATVERETAERPTATMQPQPGEPSRPRDVRRPGWTARGPAAAQTRPTPRPKAPGRTSSTDLPDGNAAIFIDRRRARRRAGRDDDAREALRDLGWSVISIRPGADWAAVAARYPSVFGSQEGDTVTTPNPASRSAAWCRHAAANGSCCPQSEPPRFLVLRPLGGSDDEVAGVFPALEQVSPARIRGTRPRRRRNRRQRRPAARRRCGSVSAPAPGRSARWPGSPWNPAPTSSSRC